MLKIYAAGIFEQTRSQKIPAAYQKFKIFQHHKKVTNTKNNFKKTQKKRKKTPRSIFSKKNKT